MDLNIGRCKGSVILSWRLSFSTDLLSSVFLLVQICGLFYGECASSLPKNCQRRQQTPIRSEGGFLEGPTQCKLHFTNVFSEIAETSLLSFSFTSFVRASLPEVHEDQSFVMSQRAQMPLQGLSQPCWYKNNA